jgi:hypothetical protein
VDVGDDRSSVIAPGRRGKGCFGSVLGLQSRDVGPDLRIIPMPLEESTHSGARITEQRLVDEIDGCGRALDVQEDRADALQRDAVRSGM